MIYHNIIIIYVEILIFSAYKFLRVTVLYIFCDNFLFRFFYSSSINVNKSKYKNEIIILALLLGNRVVLLTDIVVPARS